jgi:hypothetical protein
MGGTLDAELEELEAIEELEDELDDELRDEPLKEETELEPPPTIP